MKAADRAFLNAIFLRPIARLRTRCQILICRFPGDPLNRPAAENSAAVLLMVYIGVITHRYLRIWHATR